MSTPHRAESGLPNTPSPSSESSSSTDRLPAGAPRISGHPRFMSFSGRGPDPGRTSPSHTVSPLGLAIVRRERPRQDQHCSTFLAGLLQPDSGTVSRVGAASVWRSRPYLFEKGDPSAHCRGHRRACPAALRELDAATLLIADGAPGVDDALRRRWNHQPQTSSLDNRTPIRRRPRSAACVHGPGATHFTRFPSDNAIESGWACLLAPHTTSCC